jgi:hypothetical protein
LYVDPNNTYAAQVLDSLVQQLGLGVGRHCLAGGKIATEPIEHFEHQWFRDQFLDGADVAEQG